MQRQASFNQQIVDLLDGHRIMTIATNRPDGWPQATIVGYVNVGLVIYALIGRTSQKYANIARDPRISIAIGNDATEPTSITGLSMAARATVVSDRAEIDRIVALLFERYPEYQAFAATIQANLPDTAFMRIVPEIVSILDYSKGFAHADLVRVSKEDLERNETSRNLDDSALPAV